MKRLILFLTVVITFLCSCNDNYDIHIDDTEEIPYIEDISGTKYIASAYGSTYHREDCYIVKNMKEENIRVFYNKQFFVDRGITPCKRCKP